MAFTFKKYSVDSLTFRDRQKKRNLQWGQNCVSNFNINSVDNNLYCQNKKKKEWRSRFYRLCYEHLHHLTNTHNYMQLIVKWKVRANIAQSFGSFHRQWKHLYVQHLVTQSRGNYGRWTRSFRYCFREARRFARALCACLKTDIGARPITSQLKRDFYDLGSRFI